MAITDSQENRTPTLPNVLRRSVERMLRSVYTMIPGRVVSYDPETQKATITPLIRVPIPGASLDPNASSDDQFTEEIPDLVGVPIMFPRSKAARIYWPIYPDSLVMLVFSMYSLEKFLVTDMSTGTVDPQDTRRHSLSDAVAIPGLYPFTDPIPDLDDDDVRIILESQHGKRVEIGLGGDTGDFFVIPDNLVQLGEKQAQEPAVLGDTLKQYITDEITTAINAWYTTVKANHISLLAHIHTDSLSSPTTPPTNLVITDPTDLVDPGDDILAEKVKVT